MFQPIVGVLLGPDRRLPDLYEGELLLAVDNPRDNRSEKCRSAKFFVIFRKPIIQRKICTTRKQANSDIFNFLEMFYNPVKRTDMLAVFQRKSLNRPILQH